MPVNSVVAAREMLHEKAVELLQLHANDGAVHEAMCALQEAAAALVGLWPAPQTPAELRAAIRRDTLLWAVYNLGRDDVRRGQPTDPAPDGCRRPDSGCDWPRCGCGEARP